MAKGGGDETCALGGPRIPGLSGMDMPLASSPILGLRGGIFSGTGFWTPPDPPASAVPFCLPEADLGWGDEMAQTPLLEAGGFLH